MKHWMAATAMIVLAGCNQAETTEETAAATGDVYMSNASPEEAAKQIEAARTKNPRLPGQWEQTVEILSLEMDGVPQQMQQSLEQTTRRLTAAPVSRCISEEEAQKVNLDALTRSGGDCTYDRLKLSGGKIDAAFRCTTPQNGTSSGTIVGETKPESSEITVHSQSTLGSVPGTLSIAMRVKGHRVGDCAQ